MGKQMTSKAVVAKCISLCKARGSSKTAREMTRYFKEVVKIHGLKAPAVDQIYKEVSTLADVTSWEQQKIFSTGLTLLACDFQEEKPLGTLFLKACSTEISKDMLDQIADAINAHVYDWATCDTLSTMVLKRVIEADASLVPVFVQWSEAENLWKRRTSCVSFLKFAKNGEHSDAIEQICDQSVRMNERFVQLGAGWLLRELSVHDRQRVVQFLKSHTEWMSREGLRYALEKMPNALRKELMDYHKEQNSKKE